MKRNSFLLLFAITIIFSACRPQPKTGEWVSVFDGKTLNGWKKTTDNPESLTVEDGTIKCSGPTAHLFYEGDFKNFEFETEIKTMEHSNSGIFIHTKYQKDGWPQQGYEIQVNNSYRGSEKNPERRKTASVYNIRNVYFPVAKDNEWFKMRIKVVENYIEIFVNGVKVNEYIEPEDPWRPAGSEGLRLSHGTFALQAHDPGSTTYYRNIRVKALPAGEHKKMEVDKSWDTLVTKLAKAGFPLIDYHVHLKGGLTLDEVVANSQRLGINYGIAPNCGLHFPVTNDSTLYAYMNEVKGSPTFKGMQAEGREWITLFSPEAVSKFDYVFTDAMTFTDYKGRRNRIWIPEEVWVDDKQQFMDQLVGKIEAIFSQEPVDIYVNPTVLPAVISNEYDELWTEERMKRVVKVLADNNIALEINARYKVPSAKMIKMAKAAGVKFTFGTNNTGRDLGQLEYCIQMIEECKLTPNDIFEIKPDSLKPVNVKGFPEKITG
ncbi:MAG TPA: family 16 glycoside hydrolase [Draconibacterium sp.]|nr:family 16 glycoside hydrolase [Draconibacterium sp.]